MSRISFTENERKILQLLGRNDSLSKSQLADLGGISWATVVKMTNRLLARGTVVTSGTSSNRTKPGKKEAFYALAPDALLAVGVDVEYSYTRIILMNFRGDIAAESELPTPQNPTAESLRGFLRTSVTGFLLGVKDKFPHVVGIGIGLPGIVIPAWLKPDVKENRRNLEEYLSAATGFPVIVEINARSCTNYVKWKNPFFPGEDFVFVSIRTGVGMGMIFRGGLLVGHHFISGELGHIKVAGGKKPCRCGGKGCLETVLSQRALYAEYRKKVLGHPAEDGAAAGGTTAGIVAGMRDLFSRAARGEGPARGIVKKAAACLGAALASCLMTVFIPNIIISGHFGEDGGILLPMLEQELGKNLLPGMRVNLRYLPIDRVPFAQGDALLAINAYLDPSGGNGR